MNDATDFALPGSAVSVKDGGTDRPEHQLWLTMQAAHRRWSSATEALDEMMASARANSEVSDGALWLAKATDEQRLAFQEYIESRLAFSESFTRKVEEEAQDADEEPEELRGALAALWSAAKTSRFAAPALIAAVLCPVALGVAFVSHERKHVQELSAARDELKALLAQERAKQESRTVAVPASEKPSLTAPAAPAKPAERPKNSTAKQIALASRPLVRSVEFSVTPSARFSTVGPVRVAVHHLDYSSGTFDMSILLGDFRWEKRRVRRNERVALNLGANTTPMRLLVDRIGRNGVHGYLTIEPAAPPATSSNSKTLALSTPPRWARAD